MSLKAKLEAVIYAAEEPVTLAQLALLFTADTLEWKAEQAVSYTHLWARTSRRTSNSHAKLHADLISSIQRHRWRMALSSLTIRS